MGIRQKEVCNVFDWFQQMEILGRQTNKEIGCLGRRVCFHEPFFAEERL